jgi:hypothetical protein
MESNFNLSLARHLKDIDDLRDSRDSGIQEGQDLDAHKIADRIIQQVENTDKKILILSTSSKKRAIESASLVKDHLKENLPNIKILTSKNPDLVDLDHGEFILPKDYKIGDFYNPFKVAWSAFLTEAFDCDNPDYHFGDPIAKPDGSFKYAEMAGYFNSFGESQIDINLRLYNSIIEGYDNKNRIFNDKVHNFVLTHSLPYAIFKQLADISQKVKTEDFSFDKGSLFKICWNLYNDNADKYEYGYGDFSEVNVDLTQDEKFIEMLRDESNFLKEKYGK